MSTYIKVDHSELERAADRIDEKIRMHNQFMESANSNAIELNAYFEGDDYIAYKNQWDMVTNEDSTSKAIIRSAENYAEFLRYAANQYKTAQSEAINRAQRI